MNAQQDCTSSTLGLPSRVTAVCDLVDAAGGLHPQNPLVDVLAPLTGSARVKKTRYKGITQQDIAVLNDFDNYGFIFAA